ncbi:MAG: hypothetical protein AB1443_05625 [Pseudomonadota bacterium]
MTTRFQHAVLAAGLILGPLSAQAIGFGNVQGTPTMGERLALTIPLIEPGNLQANCIGIVPLPGGTDAAYFPRKLELALKTDGDDRPKAISLSGPTVSEPVIEFRIQITCGTSVARDYTLLAMPAQELRYAPAVVTTVQPPVTARTAPTNGESVRPVRSGRPGPSLEQMAGSRYPDQRSKREAFKRQVRTLNADVLQGVGDRTPIPLDVSLKFPAEEPQQAAPAPAKKQKPTKKKDAKHKVAKKPAKSKPMPKPVPAPAVAPEAAQAQAQPAAAPPVVAEKPEDRLQISRGGTAGDKPPQPGSLEARLADQAADTFAKQAELTARLEQSERAYNDLKEVILRMENRMLAIEKERLRLVEESQQKSDWAIPQIVLSILGGGLVGAAAMVLAQNRRKRRDADAIFDIGDSKTK